jgi:hypothetical protein
MQLGGDAACTAETSDGSSSCANQTGYGLENAYGITVSPDGLNVYVASYGDHAVAEFHRDPSTGALSEFACESDSTFQQGYCSGGADGLENAIGVSVSADGQDVYVAAGSTSGNGDIAEFARDTRVPASSPEYGELSQLPYPDDCITAAVDLDPNVGCGDFAASGVNGPEDLTLSPDGRSLYANSFDADAVLEFSRDPSSGALSQLAAPNDCISSSDASGCGTTDAPSLSGPLGVAMSPDGFDLYVADAGSSAVTTLARDPSSGALSPLGSPDDCLTVNDSGCGTDDVPGLAGARRVTVSPDGANVYVAAQNAPAVVELTRTLPAADLSIEQSGAATAVNVGDAITYTYTIDDLGPSDVDDAVVSVPLDTEETLTSASSSRGNCSGSATVSCDLGPLAAGGEATVTVTAGTASSGPASVVATVADASDVTDPDSSNNDVTASTEISEPPPTSTGAPVISGTAEAGQTLSATSGSWSGSPTNFTYDWRDCSDNSGNGCTTVQSGSSEQYTLSASDEGSFVQVLVSASNGSAKGSATSFAVGAITASPANTALPSIAGGAGAGDTLTASPGGWSGYPTPTFTYFWQDCPDGSGNGCTTVQSGSSDEYTLLGSDEGSFVQVTVIASNGIGSDASAASPAESAAVTGAPSNTALPSITAIAAAGQTLTASAGGWSGYPTPTLNYAWFDCPDDSGNGCTQVQSDSSDQYTLSTADEGSLVQVVVTASNGIGSDASAASTFTSAVTGSPANTSLPTIGGTATAGQTLSASPGAWSGDPAPDLTYVWQDCPDDSDDGCTQVQSGSSDQYTLRAADEASLVQVTVTASNDLGSDASATSAQTTAVTGPPVQQALPTLTGTTTAGQALNASSGSWSGYPTPSFTYVWQDCPDDSGNGCTTIDGAASSAYVLAASDEGLRVRVLVMASNDVGSVVSAVSSTSAVITGAAASTSPPAITGDATSGQTLTASSGSWTGYPAPTFTYAWFDCPDTSGNGCSPVASDTSDQYTLSSADEGSFVLVIVSASNSAGPDAPAASAPVGQVTGSAVNTALPSISGTATAGQALTAATGGWTGYPAPTFNYAWQLCPDNTATGCSQVQSGASDQYTPPTTVEGKLVQVVVTASNAVGSDVSVTSALTSALTGTPANTSPPSIAGSAIAGQTLTASSGNWSGYPAPTFTYTWAACPDTSGNGCTQVASGSSNQYTLQTSDEGSRVRVTVTASNDVGPKPSAMTAFTSAVTGAPVNITPPSIGGTAQQGHTLSADPGSWTANPAPTFNYQWQDCPDNSGNGCTTVQSGPNSQYTLLSSDEGKLVQVIVTAHNSVNDTSATSVLTVAVTGPPVNGTPPAVTGTARMGQTLNASTGSWSGYPAPTFTYTWQDCPDSSGNGCQTINGSVSSSYVLAVADEGLTVRVTVKATNGVGGGVSATSATTSVVTGSPLNTAPPSISGTASAGQTLTAAPGSWSGNPAPGSFAYTWQDCTANSCSNVQSGTSDQYTLGVADEGLSVRVIVTASNNLAPNGSATSARTSAVTGPPVDTALPSLVGTASSGQTLTASAGAWFGYPSLTFSYAWQDCPDNSGNGCSQVQSGSSNQYALSRADAGLFVRVVVTATNGVGSGGSAASATTAAVSAPPANTQLPSISGTAQQGVALSGSAGTWTGSPTPTLSFQWRDCDTQGNNCQSVATGGQALAYTPTAADVADTLVLSVTASNGSGSLTVASAPTAPVVIAPPSDTAPPVITGTAQQGATLSASNGTWTNSPTSFTYVWLQCDGLGNNCAQISGATATTYLPAPTDVGATLRVTVTASNALGPGSATSAQTAAVLIGAPVNSQLPAISGTAGQGQLLTAADGSWANSPTSFSYVWQQCDATGANCSPITNATAGDYVTQPGDVGHTLRLVATAFNAGGNTAATSAQTAIIGTLPANTAPPTVSGVTQQGRTLTITDGGWTGTPAPTFTYQWEQCDGAGNNCATIFGATTAGYTPAAGDVGHTLRAQVIATNTAGTKTATTAATPAAMTAAPTNSALPAVSGSAQPGQSLAASPGTWNNAPTGLGYQWAQCDGAGNACAPITGATSSSYVALAGDIGHTLRVTVTATNAGGSGQATSAQSQVVSSAPPSNTASQTAGVTTAAPSSTAGPVISGTVQQGHALSLSNGSWANSPTAFSYQWLRCDDAGNSCSPISAATGNKYVPASADGGHTLRATVTASNAGGATAATSAKTAVVSSLQASAAAPILGQTTNLAPVAGTVLVRLPGSKTFTRLTGAADLPMGSTIDARSGKVTLTVALPHGRTQTGQFYDGEFVLTQASDGMTILTLTGASFAGCPATTTGANSPAGGGSATGGATTNGARASAAKNSPTTVVRQLWGNAHGDFTTKGRYGSAAVSGTVWLTQDRCDGTYVKVTKDNVIVVDYAHPHTKHNIKQGHHILIAPPVH